MKNTISLIFVVVLVLLSGCTPVYKTTGQILNNYAEDHGLPYLLASNDELLACDMSQAFTPFLMSFSRMDVTPEKLAILLHLMSGSCLELEGREQELRYLRAVRAKNSIEAHDARIVEQRLLSRSAERYMQGYEYVSSYFGEPGTACPEIDQMTDEFYWMMGLINGLQAVLNDTASAGRAHVPLDIAAKVSRGAQCLDHEKWWGVPLAMNAVVQLTLPHDTVVEAEYKQAIDQALIMANKHTIGLSYVMATQLFWGTGDLSAMKKTIREYFQSDFLSNEVHPYRMLNQIAFRYMQLFSDRYWTLETGSRTPYGKLGSFPDENTQDTEVEILNLEEIL